MSKKEYPCIESRATFRVSGYTVRVWRIEKTVEEAIQASHEDIRLDSARERPDDR
jgi:hypothetical protein